MIAHIKKGMKNMKNIMICVTQQKTCDRLIQYGNNIRGDNDGELFIIHVAHYKFNFLGHTKEGDALEYLYEKALKYDANLTVVRSNNVAETLVTQVKKNKITHIVLGESGETDINYNIVNFLEKKLGNIAELLVIPAVKLV